MKDKAKYEAGLSPEAKMRREWRQNTTPEQRKERYRAAATQKRWAALPPERRAHLEKWSRMTTAEKRSYWRITEMESRRKMFLQFKNRPCLDCGGTFPVEVMDFDHVRGQKRKAVSRLRTVKQVEAEVAKCDLVCANCHRVRTSNRRHGLPAVLPPPEYFI